MSLTLPTSGYDDQVKLGNIVENWVFQLGYDEAYDVAVSLTDEPVDNSETRINVDDYSEFAVGDLIKIDDEVMQVYNLVNPTSIDVYRGVEGTTAVTHLENESIYFYNFLPISLHGTSFGSIYYHGVVQKSPTIRTSMDLATSQAKSGNITLSLNNIQYKGDDLSAELFSTSGRKYINRVCKIYSCMPGATALSDCLQVANLRLTDMTHNDNTITLSLVEARPWDFLTVPNTKTTTEIYIPVAYGDFTKNTHSTNSSFLTSKKLFPCPNVNNANNDIFYFAYPKTYGSDAIPHYYDQNIDLFIPFTDASDATSTLVGADVNGVPLDMERGYFLIRPLSPAGWTNSDNSIDGNVSTFANGAADPGVADPDESLSDTDILTINIPTVDGELIEFYVYVKGEITHNHTSGTTSSALRVNSGSMISRSSDGTTATSGYTINGNTGYSRIDALGETTINVNLYTTAAGILPSTNGEGTGTGKIYDIVLQLKVQSDVVNELNAATDKVSKIKEIYTGVDGLTNSFTGGAGNVTTGLEAHRDILVRYTGTDESDANIYNWDTNLDIEASRITTPWGIRWWALKPVNVRKTLDQLQYEFGFIFKWRADGSLSYWYVKDDYIDGTDEAAKLTEKDVRKLKVSNSPFGELLTKMNINYEKHPTGSKYLTSVSPYADTARTDWNIQTEENIEEVDLDAYITPTIVAYDNNTGTGTDVDQSSANDDFFSYYYKIFGNVRLIVECDIINPKYYNLETGDVIQFNYSLVDPFGKSWTTPLWFMITDLTRSIGVMKIKCREVHSG